MEFDDDLRAVLQQRLANFSPQLTRTIPHKPNPVPAAVALALVEEGHGAGLPGLPRSDHWSTRAALVLTRRAAGLRRHAGQWALPGGRLDPGESPTQAAIREMAEEVGIQVDECALLGRLDDFATRSGFVMTPLVVWAGAAPNMKPNPAEVRSVHRIPLDEFLRPDAPLIVQEAGLSAPVLCMPIGNTQIAAPTAAILYQFREVCLCSRHTRVDHFEQPRFAWR